MRFVSFPAVGLILVVLGVALMIPHSNHLVIYNTNESAQRRFDDGGVFGIDPTHLQTILLNPVVGGIALTAGLVFLFLGLKEPVPERH